MESPIHPMSSLFDQLGLDSADQAIESFIDNHRPLQGDIELHKSDFWSARSLNQSEQMLGE